ncbi:MAG TPA: hypothetical protein VL523_19230 [Terriglobia bacterium]|nr:hypothetical protein [Terriglobia bacterium]
MSLHKYTRSFLAVFLGLLLAAPALAQYPGGNGGSTGSGGTTGTYNAPSGGYGSSTGIAIGAGVAAAAGITYLALRGRGKMVGCVEPSTDGNKLMNEKDRNTYALVATNIALMPGERVALRGKKSRDDSGRPIFAVTKLVKDYGSCKP